MPLHTHPQRTPDAWRRTAGFFAAATACAIASSAAGAPVEEPAAELLAKYTALTPRLEQSQFEQRLHIESVEGSRVLQGDVYAIVDYPITTVSDAFTNPDHWCEALILHLNVKYCRPVARGASTALSVAISRKDDQTLTRAYRIEFVYGVAASLPYYMKVELDAGEGPLGTGNYHIALEAVGLKDERAFVHLRYSYAYGFWARVAMLMYLHGTGSGKVGFTIIGDPNDPQPKFIGGVRGAIERNVMRYYLAVDAYLWAFATPAPERFEKSLGRWFDATERYPRQLHEVDRDTYLAMKRREYLQQQTAQ